MKKKILIILLSLFFCTESFAETFFFKGCKINNVVSGNYVINLEENVIEVELKSADGVVQNFSDEIKSIKADKIVSKKIKSNKGENIYYQYFLNPQSKSVIKIEFKKQTIAETEVFKLFTKKVNNCSEVNSGWDKAKIDKNKAKKEQKEILQAQEKIKKEEEAIFECQGDDFNKWTKCKGAFTAETGHRYSGIFENGKIIRGISIYPGGAKYVGDFKNFKPNGFGTFVWANGDKYYGGWINGKSHGDGTKVWKSGRKYLGEFKNDKLDGSGTLFYPDGKKYEGEFVNGKRHGKGTFIYPDGSAYIGKFIAGKEHGVGDCVSIEGLSQKCKNKTEVKAKDFSGKDTRKISLVSKKWVRISQYEANNKKAKKIMDKLRSDFEIEAKNLCDLKNYNVLEKKIEVLEIDETPAYGLETKLKVGINGVVECK